MARIRTRLEGAKELDRVLGKLPKQLRGRVLTRAVRGGANIVRKEMRGRAPVETGRLRDNIVTRARRDRGASVTVSVGPARRTFYAGFIEFGTRFLPARPFLRPAFETVKFAALEEIGKRLGTEIEKAAVKLAGSFATSGLKAKRRRPRRRP